MPSRMPDRNPGDAGTLSRSVRARAAGLGNGPDTRPSLPRALRNTRGLLATEVFFGRILTQNRQFQIGKEDFRGQVRRFSAEQCHKHNAPGYDHIDGNEPFEPFGGLMPGIFNLTTRFKYPVPILDSPTFGIGANTKHGVFRQIDSEGSEQKPFKAFLPFGWMLFQYMDGRNFDGLFVTVYTPFRRPDLHSAITYGHVGRTRRSRRLRPKRRKAPRSRGLGKATRPSRSDRFPSRRLPKRPNLPARSVRQHRLIPQPKSPPARRRRSHCWTLPASARMPTTVAAR